jgi:hypothetical protein
VHFTALSVANYMSTMHGIDNINYVSIRFYLSGSFKYQHN